MREGPEKQKPVRILADGVARKIAAGEVIDRPFSVVRELLDNAIDSGAKDITLEIRKGGTESVRISDNGTGMTGDDLEICCLPHATSKIENVDDLFSCRSLGFRGEALAGIAAVSRLTIKSAPRSGPGNILRIHGGKTVSLRPGPASPGTVVDAEDLFYNLPARKRFLKSSAAESAMCRSAFLEKALPFPNITFRIFSEGNMKTYLPAGDIVERIKTSYPGNGEAVPLEKLGGTGENFSVTLVAAPPDYNRRDRKYLQIYVNSRRIWDYSLVQGLEYGFSSAIPGGRFPIAFVFIQIDPRQVDFNIHPAKKEARFHNVKEIRRVLSDMVHNYVTSNAVKSVLSGEKAADLYQQPVYSEAKLNLPHKSAEPRKHSAQPNKTAPETFDLSRKFEPGREEYTFRYIGPVFGLFLAAEKEETLYLVDQHAAHERILYERIMKKRTSQKLLIPLSFDIEEMGEEFLSEKKEELADIGITVQKKSGGTWELHSVPEGGTEMEEAVLQAIRELCTGTEEAGTKLRQNISARIACRAAVKDGDRIDPETARQLIDSAFKLETPRCPHGRPIWFRIGKEDLFRSVRRIV